MHGNTVKFTDLLTRETFALRDTIEPIVDIKFTASSFVVITHSAVLEWTFLMQPTESLTKSFSIRDLIYKKPQSTKNQLSKAHSAVSFKEVLTRSPTLISLKLLPSHKLVTGGDHKIIY